MILDPSRYTIAWIAPLEIEARAAACALDRRHTGRFPMQRGDDYVFQAGEVCGHNVVIATLPRGQEYGTGSAAALASQVKKFFSNLWFGLLVGVAAGLPKLTGPSPRDIRLGDVLVALPEGDSAGLIAYDLGKETGSGFQLLQGGHVLAATETVVRAAIGSIKLKAPDDVDLILPHYNRIQDEAHSSGTFADPGQDADRLYETHESGTPTIRQREPRPVERRTRIWYGPIGSGEKLIKNAKRRDELRDRFGLIGLEMEAAGTMNRIPVGVIRGVCDYGDEYKNKKWQPYAAAMAAAYAKAVFTQIGPRGPMGVSHIPFERNKNFTGRKKQVSQLERMFFVEQRERAALAGLGGMGKTQIALELAYRVRNMEVEGMIERHSVLWMPAQSMAAYQRAAAEVVQKLGIEGDDDPKEALRIYLESEAAGYWFLVIDNVDKTATLDSVPRQSDGLRRFLPRNEKGRLLVTTRLSSVGVDTAGGNVVEVSSMSPDEARSFLETSLIDKAGTLDRDTTKELLEKLAYMPLTLAQAAAYMNKRRTPIKRYLQRCRSADKNMIDLLSTRLRDATYHSESQGAVATTWIVSFEAIYETDANAVRLLSFIQWIDSKAIPISMLASIGSEIDVEDSIGLLCEYGFLKWREDGETLDMHSLVHLALQAWSKQADKELLTEDNAIEYLEKMFPSDEWENRVTWRQYLPHVIPLVMEVRLQQDKRLLSLGHRVGLCLRVDGRIKEMVSVMEHVVSVKKNTLTETHPERLSSQHVLAIAYEADGRVKEAIKVLEHVAAMSEALGETHPTRLASQRSLALVYKNGGRVKEAIKLLGPVVTIQQMLAETHPNRLASQHALAIVYKADGRVNESVKLLEHVVAIQETLAETNPYRLAAQHVLATAYKDNGQIKEAIEVLEHVAAIRQEILGKTHLDRLSTQNALAIAYKADGRVKESIKVLEPVVAIRKEVLAETHPDLLASQYLLAMLYKTDGRVTEAIKVLEHLVAIHKETLPETDPFRLSSQHWLAILVYEADGRVDEAIKLLEHVVAIRKQTLAETHPHRLASQQALARVCRANDQVTDGSEYLYVTSDQVEDGPEYLGEASGERRLLPRHRLRWWKNKK